MMKVISGKELDAELKRGIEKKVNEFTKLLSSYDGIDLFHKWRFFLRGMDEIVNLYYVLDEKEMRVLNSCTIYDFLWGRSRVDLIFKMLRHKFGFESTVRLLGSFCMFSAILIALQLRIPEEFSRYNTVYDIISFCQSRRLYYVSFLSMILKYANGNDKVEYMDLLNVFQYPMESMMRAITTGLHQILINSGIDGYSAYEDEQGIKFARELHQLEEMWVEPTIMNELDVLLYDENDESQNSATCEKKLYSFDELRTAIRNIRIRYKRYDIDKLNFYVQLCLSMEFLQSKVIDDYWFDLTEEEFEELYSILPDKQLLSNPSGYFETVNERAAFYHVSGRYYSTVLMMIRYMENRIYELLKRKRRFQIRSGFVFERKVSDLLAKYDFRDTKVKRIHKKEFDVICLRNGTAYNFQCKNNFFNINRLSLHNIDKVCHDNRRLINYYLKALQKEDERENLIKERFEVDRVESYVITRFPVVCDNERIISFNNFEGMLIDLI